MEDLLAQVTKRANRYINEIQTRRVSPSPDDIANLKNLDVPLQDQPIGPATVLAELDDIASPATVASTSGRFFGFVIGGCLPAQAGIGSVSGATMANFTGLAAARHALLSASGWDVESMGLSAGG